MGTMTRNRFNFFAYNILTKMLNAKGKCRAGQLRIIAFKKLVYFPVAVFEDCVLNFGFRFFNIRRMFYNICGTVDLN